MRNFTLTLLMVAMPAAMSFWAPNINSYRRYRGGISCAPVSLTWGDENRTVAFRVPLAKQGAWRVENRVPGADANPYLVTAAIAAGVHHGLKNKCDPGRMIEEGELVTLKTRVPDRWDYALDKLGRSKILPDYLGADYCKYYLSNRRSECRQFHNTINPLDFDWYLRSV